MLLAVNSKNDQENALAGIEHPDGPLKADDFACIKANWENKDLNMRAIAAQLNLGADSFVFVDDNPVERQIVRSAGLDISVPELNGVEGYVRAIDRGGYFEVTSLSEDDLSRTAMYKANARRYALQDEIGSYEDFLESLDMHATIRRFESIYVQRIAQLTNKSNQFNLTTLRCTVADVEAMQRSTNHICLYGKLEDRFGDNGVVSVVVGELIGNELHMRLWLMSCRVLKRGMEEAMLDALLADAKAAGVRTIVGYYYPTPKNAMVKDFYDRMGFDCVEEDAQGNTVWRLDVGSFIPVNTAIMVTR